MTAADDAVALVDRVVAGSRRDLAKAITRIESTLVVDRAYAQRLLAAALPHAGRAIRVAISGAPGVGKSTFIEALGVWLCERGHRVAVLAVDPSSTQSGGSILGDKTRMERLAQDARAFIRPSPSAGTLGGVAARTREAMVLCEAAGYDVVLVETVGVGQSEVAVAGMTDVFVLLQLATAGDELQAIKRGIVELADVVLYNKAELDPAGAERAMGQMRAALGVVRGAGELPPVLGVSAATGAGVEAAWQAVAARHGALVTRGQLDDKRRHQAVAWMDAQIDDAVRARLLGNAAVVAERERVAAEVAAGHLDPGTAAAAVIERMFG